jgi:hypothetical protein
VNKLEVERVEEEIDYIARRRSKNLSICDANFGILPRDVEIAEHIVRVNKRGKTPSRVTYNSAKNHPDRVEQIARIFTEAGLLHNQSISLQTMNAEALRLAKRDNIKKETYLRLQRRLNEWGVPSFIELIWPMPGETLESFKDGVNELCEMGAQCFTVYPLLWLNNVGYLEKTDEYGIATLREDDPVGNSEIVIRTNEVSYEDCIRGLLFTMAVYLLYNCRGLYTTSILLNALGVATFRKVFESFVATMERRQADEGIVKLWRDGEARFEEMVNYIWRGAIADGALHSLRQDFDRLLAGFMSEHPEWTSAGHGRMLAAAFEFDLLNRPYPFVHTPFDVGVPLEHLSVKEKRRGIWVVDSPYDFPAILTGLKTRGRIDERDLAERPTRITINHRPRQVFQVPGKSEEERHWHIHQVVREIGHFEPVYESLPGSQATACT